MRSMIMVVYNDLTTDARVKRSADALKNDFNLCVLGTNTSLNAFGYNEIGIKTPLGNGLISYYMFLHNVKKYVRSFNPDILYLHDYYSAPLIRWAKKRKTIKVIYDSHELIIPEKGVKISKREQFFYCIEKRNISFADLIFCANANRGQIMKNHYHLNMDPVVIENISYLSVTHDDVIDNVCEECFKMVKSNEKILVYAGVLSRSRNIDRLIDVTKNIPSLFLLVVGDGEDKERLLRLAKEKIEGRFSFTGKMPYKYLGTLLTHCDVGFISYPNNSLNNKYCAPNKIYEYAGVGVPMIAPFNPTINDFFSKNKIGIIGDNLTDACNQVLDNIDLYKDNCTSFVKENPWEERVALLRSEVNALR